MKQSLSIYSDALLCSLAFFLFCSKDVADLLETFKNQYLGLVTKIILTSLGLSTLAILFLSPLTKSGVDTHTRNVSLKSQGFGCIYDDYSLMF